MKKYIGYYIIGANSKKDARDEKGLLLWSQTKPSALKRYFSRLLLGIYWIDKEQSLEDRGKTKQSSNSTTQFPKLVKAEKPKRTPKQI
jgi:hypothetical protein